MISRRLNAERVVVLGWSRAILLQLAHPLMAEAVANHSSFRGGAIAAARRLGHTVRAMRALTFGDSATEARALHAIRAIHARVHGELRHAIGPFAAGTRYSAEDPDLVRWVHVTLADSVMLAYDTFVTPLTPGERDAYCEEAAGVAIALGARPEDVPRTAAGLARDMDATLRSGRIIVDAEARTLAAAVLRPASAVVVGPLGWINRTVTVGLLPDEIRRQYGYRWDRPTAARFARTVRLVRIARAGLPARMALWPEARAARQGDSRRPIFTSPDGGR